MGLGRTARAALVLAVVALGTAPPAAAQAPSCAAFDAWEWAQSVYDADPAAHAALDPDGDGIASPELPHGAAPALWTDEVPDGAEEATLVRVVDGDTIEVERADGSVEDVRLILLGTPESVDPNRPDECFGAEATAFTTWLLSLAPEGTVWLEKDVSERDRFGRLLRYVWIGLGDGEDYNVSEAVGCSGYGGLATFPPDVKYVEEIREAQAFARKHELGLWAVCDGIHDPLPASEQPPPAPAPQPEPEPPAGACDPSYPTVCIPPYPPDLDCGQIAPRRFQVVPPDPHGFDGDGDGVGCESG